MYLKEVIIQNYRGYKNIHRIPVEKLTAFIGKNDAGKSTILDALAVFFDHPLGKIDASDICVHSDSQGELRIGCVFTDFPTSIEIDAVARTTLADEYLLNADGHLEIHKVYEFTAHSKLSKSKIIAIANHPTANGLNNLLSLKITDLKKKADELGVDANVDRRVSRELRRAIWASNADLQLKNSEIQLDKEDTKIIWEQLVKYLPEYALFRADRASTDDDSEVQDPLKIAIKQAVNEVQAELDVVMEKVKERTLDVAQRTIAKLSEFDKNLASQLKPGFKTDPKWDSIFKLSLTGDDDIPINKRGSGVRRLILFSFFRAETERLQHESKKTNIIYAIEEPETAQHPDNQLKILETLQSIANSDGCQVILTTHVPGVASQLPINSIRYIQQDLQNSRKTLQAKDDDVEILKLIANDLGVFPDKRAKVLVCVEGVHDFQFLKHINKLLIDEDHTVIDIFNDPRVAQVVLGGSTLKEWVNQHFLKNVGLPEVHIYDRDEPKNGKYKYGEYADSVNSRTDRSIAFLTQKREMENYLDISAINQIFQPVINKQVTFQLTDDCDVEKEVKAACGQDRIDRRTLKHWLNDDVASVMTLDMLKQRQGYDEIKNWFNEIAARVV